MHRDIRAVLANQRLAGGATHIAVSHDWSRPTLSHLTSRVLARHNRDSTRLPTSSEQKLPPTFSSLGHVRLYNEERDRNEINICGHTSHHCHERSRTQLECQWLADMKRERSSFSRNETTPYCPRFGCASWETYWDRQPMWEWRSLPARAESKSFHACS